MHHSVAIELLKHRIETKAMLKKMLLVGKDGSIAPRNLPIFP
jgi:hypothetical protein